MNKVVVNIVEYNDRMVDGFRRYVYDSPLIVFQQGGRIDLGGGHGNATFCESYNGYSSIANCWNNNGYNQEVYQSIVPLSTAIDTGGRIRTRYTVVVGWPPVDVTYATAGFRVMCTWTGTRGFLTTAGDTFNNGDHVIDRRLGFGAHVGTVRRAIFRSTQPQFTTPRIQGINVSFVEIHAPHQISNIMPNGQSLTPLGYTHPRVGDRVDAVSGMNGMIMTGTIRTLNGVIPIAGGYRLYDMPVVHQGTIRVISGNSGGPVFTLHGSPVGLISGGDPSQNSIFIMPMSRAVNEFRIHGFNFERW